jgi:hypothetical protein
MQNEPKFAPEGGVQGETSSCGTIYWSFKNKERAISLVDMTAECTLVHGNPECFPHPWAVIDEYWVKQVILGKYLL